MLKSNSLFWYDLHLHIRSGDRFIRLIDMEVIKLPPDAEITVCSQSLIRKPRFERLKVGDWFEHQDCIYRKTSDEVAYSVTANSLVPCAQILEIKPIPDPFGKANFHYLQPGTWFRVSDGDFGIKTGPGRAYFPQNQTFRDFKGTVAL